MEPLQTPRGFLIVFVDLAVFKESISPAVERVLLHQGIGSRLLYKIDSCECLLELELGLLEVLEDLLSEGVGTFSS